MVKKQKNLLYKHKIKCVGDLKLLTKTKQKTMVDVPALSKYIAIAKGCKNEKCPHKVTNFKKKANPYKAKLGNDWIMHIKKAVAFSPFVCITKMIAHIIQQS